MLEHDPLAWAPLMAGDLDPIIPSATIGGDTTHRHRCRLDAWNPLDPLHQTLVTTLAADRVNSRQFVD